MNFQEYLKQLKIMEEVGEKKESLTEQELIKAYNTSLKEMFLVLSSLYQKHSTGGVLTFEELQRAKRYEGLIYAINKELHQLTGQKLDIIKGSLSDIFSHEFLGSAELVTNEIEKSVGFFSLEKETIEKAVEMNVAGLTLNERLEKHRIELEFVVKQTITQGLILGVGYREMSERLQSVLERDVTKANRIVRTESNRVRNQAREKFYKEASEKGLKLMKIWNARRDNRTRKNHRKLDGVMVGIDENFELGKYKAPRPLAFGYPEMDINCRCRIVTVPIGVLPPKRNKTWEEVDAEFVKKEFKKAGLVDEEKPKKKTKTEELKEQLKKSKEKTKQAKRELEQAKTRRDKAKKEYEEKKRKLLAYEKHLKDLKNIILALPEGKQKEEKKKEFKKLKQTINRLKRN